LRGLHFRYDVDDLIITREIIAAKIHFNILIVTSRDMSVYHRKNGFRFSYDVQELYDYGNRERVFYYMIKESWFRHFYDDQDIYEYTTAPLPRQLPAPTSAEK